MNVTVSNIVFTGCYGATLSGFDETFDSHINSTAPFFTSCHSALFTCVQNFITFTDVTIDHYYGFAIVTIDTLGALFSNMTISHGIYAKECYSPGSGVLILFTYKLSLHSNLTVQKSKFFDNNYKGESTPGEACHSPFLNPHQVTFAASLTYIVYNTTHSPLLAIDGTHFSNFDSLRFGVISGLLILMFNTPGSDITIEESSFHSEPQYS